MPAQLEHLCEALHGLGEQSLECVVALLVCGAAAAAAHLHRNGGQLVDLLAQVLQVLERDELEGRVGRRVGSGGRNTLHVGQVADKPQLHNVHLEGQLVQVTREHGLARVAATAGILAADGAGERHASRSESLDERLERIDDAHVDETRHRIEHVGARVRHVGVEGEQRQHLVSTRPLGEHVDKARRTLVAHAAARRQAAAVGEHVEHDGHEEAAE